MPAKKAPRTKGAPDLRQLIARLRQAASQLEADLPALDLHHVAPFARKLGSQIADFLAAEEAAMTVPRADYQALRGEWLEAWSRFPDAMSLAVGPIVGPPWMRVPADMDLLEHRLRLLGRCLIQIGADSTAALVRQVLDALQPPTASADFGMKIDREANAALREWGRLPEDDFVAQWSTIEPALLKRACMVLGIRVSKHCTRQQRTDLHRRARRFARNTGL